MAAVREAVVSKLFAALEEYDTDRLAETIALKLPSCKLAWRRNEGRVKGEKFCGHQNQLLVGRGEEGWTARLYFTDKCKIDIRFITPQANFGTSQQFAACILNFFAFEKKIKASLQALFGDDFKLRATGIFEEPVPSSGREVPKAAYAEAVGGFTIDCCY